ncbi:MAG: hypothetical protein CVV27_14840, partial [Candidatus Melainabacteria bacterium HGW-Melainabacteria-1]
MNSGKLLLNASSILLAFSLGLSACTPQMLTTIRGSESSAPARVNAYQARLNYQATSASLGLRLRVDYGGGFRTQGPNCGEIHSFSVVLRGLGLT